MIELWVAMIIACNDAGCYEKIIEAPTRIECGDAVVAEIVSLANLTWQTGTTMTIAASQCDLVATGEWES